ncbi:MAG: acetolactate synthase [Planctomycetes bacterium]|nr:acetolactate synthase [Planctomycetota bacterium]
MEVTNDLFGRKITQFALFLENRVGKLLEIVKLLAGVDTHILAISVNEASDHAVVRIVVDRPMTAREVLENAGVPLVESTVIAVEMSEELYSIHHILRVLLQAEINVMYAYPLLVRSRRHAVIVFHVDNDDYAIQVLQEQGIHVLNQDDIARGTDLSS